MSVVILDLTIGLRMRSRVILIAEAAVDSIFLATPLIISAVQLFTGVINSCSKTWQIQMY